MATLPAEKMAKALLAGPQLPPTPRGLRRLDQQLVRQKL